MRDYNFRRKAKAREQASRKTFYYDRGYSPSTPKEIVGDNGELYYTEGSLDSYKQHLKRRANKKVRTSPLEETKEGSHHKRKFDLPWEWY